MVRVRASKGMRNTYIHEKEFSISILLSELMTHDALLYRLQTCFSYTNSHIYTDEKKNASSREKEGHTHTRAVNK